MYFGCIAIIFAANLIFGREDPPLEFYALFMEKDKFYYYYGNLFYQLILFLMLLLCASAVESAFVMFTIFASARLKFIVKLLDMLSAPDFERGFISKIDLINIIIGLHSNVLLLVFSKLFQYLYCFQNTFCCFFLAGCKE